MPTRSASRSTRPGHLAVRRRRVRQRRHDLAAQLLAAFAARQMRRPVKLVLTRKQYVHRHRLPARRAGSGWPSAPTGRAASRAIVHDSRTETSRYDAYEDSIIGRGEIHVQHAQRALGVPHCAAGREPADLHARARLHHAARSRSSRRWTTWPPAGHRPDRAAAAQRTRPRPVRRTAVLHPPAERLLPAGRATVRLVTAQPDAALDARRRPAHRHRHGRGGVTTPRAAQCAASARVNADGTADVQCRDQRHGPRHLHLHDPGRRRRPRPAHAPGSGSRSATAGFPRRPCTAARGPWPASAPPCSRRRTCCATGSFAPRSTTRAHR